MILPSPTWEEAMCHQRGYHLQTGADGRVSPWCKDCGIEIVGGAAARDRDNEPQCHPAGRPSHA